LTGACGILPTSLERRRIVAKGTRTAKAVSIAKKAASTAKRTSKRSGRKPDLKRHIENVEKAFEELKRENEGKGFTFIAADEIEREDHDRITARS
jgi:hypothetical protein